ncbi:maternal effect embryo arrest 18 [Tanacetum coccineum]
MMPGRVVVNSSALPSMIKRVFYMSSEGSNLLHEVFPTVNPSVLEQLRNVDCIIYGMGSLFTSICPSIFLEGQTSHFLLAMGGARIFFQSLDAAIFLFSRVSQIPTESLVLPVISTNDRLTLGCGLWDGTIIRGQNEISHPASGSLQLIDKGNLSALPSMIKRVFYMSSEGSNLLHEVFPTVNPSVLEQLRNVDCIIYGMGSLFTSICPSLVLLGVGEIISSRSCAKVLLLNGTYDRETSGFSASCFVTAITDALNRTYGHLNNSLKNNPSQYINTIFVPKDGQIPVDIKSLAAQGIVHVVHANQCMIQKWRIVYEQHL